MLRFQFIFSIITLITFSSLSQEYKGNLMLNASISGGSSNRLDHDNEQTKINTGIYYVNLKAGYFVKNRSSIGILLGYSWDSETDRGTFAHIEANKINSFDIGPYYKEYFKIFKNFYFTLNVSSFYRFTSLKKSFPDGEYDSYNEIKENAIYLSITPGMSFDFNEKFSVEFELGFFNAYVKFKTLLDSPTVTEERHQVIYGTSTTLNEFDLNDILFGFTYRIKLN